MPQRRMPFTIPGVAGQYAPEIYWLNGPNDPEADFDLLVEVGAVIESLPAGATIDVELLKTNADSGGGDPSYIVADASSQWNAVGIGAVRRFAGHRGARVRGKSAGAGGAAVAHVSWRSPADGA